MVARSPDSRSDELIALATLGVKSRNFPENLPKQVFDNAVIATESRYISEGSRPVTIALEGCPGTTPSECSGPSEFLE